MSRELLAALVYVLAAFALGFVLGPLRELWLLPAIGRLPALLVELPILLGFCWWIAPRIARRIPPGGARLRMGGAAFAILLALEFGLGTLVRGWDLAGWLGELATPHGAVGLLGYALFALIPWARGLQRQP